MMEEWNDGRYGMMGIWNVGMMEEQGIGIMEWWNMGRMKGWSLGRRERGRRQVVFTTFQYSIIPIFRVPALEA
jgi:hypothetical protein